MTERKAFEGVAITDTHPTIIAAVYVRKVGMFDVPASLREHAVYALGDLSGGVWWTVGEFLYAGESVYDTAVARRVGVQVQYGVEKEG